MKVLVTGADGLLGSAVVQRLKTENHFCYGLIRPELDITDFDAVKSHLFKFNPEIVIHCAAYTKVDQAEDEQDLCNLTNVGATENIAGICAQLNAKMVYISTDYVFDGSGTIPYEVSDPPQPINYYGRSKYLGEYAVQRCIHDYFIIRVSWLFGPNGKNFVNTMLSLANQKKEIAVVGDQIGSPTYTPDIAALISDMIETDKFGIYHATNEGYCSWYDFACQIFQMTDYNPILKQVSSHEYPTKAKRPLNSRLSKKSLDISGFPRLPPYQDALRRYLPILELDKQGAGI